MHADIKQFLFNLLTETKAIAETENAAPHDYASLREFMLQQELKQECDALLTLLLDDHSDFEMKFKQRCKMRETDDLNTLSLKDIPESITNQLYWKIATTVFKPKTLLEMLDIVLPSLKNYVEIHLERPVNPPREFGQRKAEDILKPVIKTSTDRNSLSKLAPELAVLTHFVLTDRDIFHVGEIADYPLTLHVKSQGALQQVHPNIAEKLYQHNPEFQVLEQDIITLKNKGTSPKTAIENLIRGLNFGGTQMTGSTYANQSAEEAVKQFLNYINALPESTRTNLRAIRSGNLTIGKIIDEEIAIGSCVETTARHFNTILQEHQNNPILNALPILSPLEIKTLKDNYKDCSLYTVKDPNIVPKFPSKLSKQALEKVCPKTTEEFILLLLNFPATLYDLFLKNVTLDAPLERLYDLFKILEQGVFTLEQKKALIKAIITHFPSFNVGEEILALAGRTASLELLNEYFSAVPEQERAAIVLLKNQNDFLALHDAANQPESLQIILQMIPEAKRLSVIQTRDINQHSLLHVLRKNSASLRIALESLPVSQRLAAVMQELDSYTHLHFAADSLDVLHTMLEFLPVDQRLTAIQKRNSFGETVLHHIIRNTPQLYQHIQIILDSLPVDQRVTALLTQNYSDKSVILLFAEANMPIVTILRLIPQNQIEKLFDHGVLFANISDQLPACFQYIPLNQQSKFCEIQDAVGNTVLHISTRRISFLKCILNLYQTRQQKIAALERLNENGETVLMYHAELGTLQAMLDIYEHDDEKIAAIEHVDHKGNTLLHRYANSPKILEFLLNLYAEDKKISAIELVNDSGQTVLHRAAGNLESLCIILAVYPEDQPWLALQKVDHTGNTVLHEMADHQPSHLLPFLKVLPQEQITALINRVNNNGSTPLHLERDIKNVREILKLLPADQRLAMLVKADHEGYSVLHFAPNNQHDLIKTLEVLPENQRAIAVMHENNLLPALNHTCDIECLKYVLNFYPEDKRWEAIDKPDRQGNTLLHKMVMHTKRMNMLLECYPEHLRYVALLTENKQGETPLSLAIPYYECLEDLLKFIPEERRTIALMQSDRTGNSIFHLTSAKRMLEQIPKHETVIAIRAKDKDGRSVLQSYFKANNNFSCHYLATCPDLQRLTVLNSVDNHGLTLLHDFAGNPAVLKTILKLYPEAAILAALTKNDNNGFTPLHLAAAFGYAAVKIMLFYIEKDQLFTALNKRTTSGFTVLHQINTFQCLKTILDNLSDEQKWLALDWKDNNGTTVLRHFLENGDLPHSLLELFPVDKRLAIISQVNDNGEILLHDMQNGAGFLVQIPETQRLAAVQMEDNNGNTMLHFPHVDVQAILQIYPADQRLAALQKKNKHGDTVLHRQKLVDSVKFIISLYPEEQRIAAIEEQNENGDTVLTNLLSCLGIVYLKFILDLYPTSQIHSVLQKVNKHGNTILHKALPSVVDMNDILNYFPADQRLAMLETVNNEGNSVLHCAASKTMHIRDVLELFPVDNRTSAILKKSKLGNTVVHVAAKHLDDHDNLDIKAILATLDEEQQIAIAGQANLSGDTPLHIAAAKNIYSLRRMIVSLPEQCKLYPALIKKDAQDNTVLHLSAKDFEGFQEILSCYPNERRLEAILQVNKQGHSVLDLIYSRYYNLLLELLPEQDRLSMLKMRVNGESVLSSISQSLIKHAAFQGAFRNSFVPALINIYRFLTEQENLDTPCVGFFNSTSKAIMLKAQIDACDSFDEIKKCLLDVITPNQKLPFCKALLRRMGTVRLDVLEPQTPIFQ